MINGSSAQTWVHYVLVYGPFTLGVTAAVWCVLEAVLDDRQRKRRALYKVLGRFEVGEPNGVPGLLSSEEDARKAQVREEISVWKSEVPQGWAAASPLRRFKDGRRRAKIEEQLPDALDYLARALKAGHGFRSGLSILAQESEDPIGSTLRVATDAINGGMPVEQALRAFARDTGSSDVDFFVTAVLIQKDTGGNLAELLATMARLIRSRARLRDRVRVASAEGRTSGLVLAALPFVMVGILTMVNPRYAALLWETEGGRIATGLGACLMVIGGVWIRSIVRIKI